MLLSGGTTSLSKLIPRTHNDYVYNARVCAEVAGFSSDTVFLAMLPLGHNYNLACPGLLGAFYAGGTLVIATEHGRRRVFTTIARERVTVHGGGRSVDHDVAEQRSVASSSTVSSLQVVQNGGARLPPELRARLRREFELHPAGDLRHRRRPHQHDPARPTPTTCCSRAPAHRSVTSTRSRCWTMRAREVPDGERANW